MVFFINIDVSWFFLFQSQTVLFISTVTTAMKVVACTVTDLGNATVKVDIVKTDVKLGGKHQLVTPVGQISWNKLITTSYRNLNFFLHFQTLNELIYLLDNFLIHWNILQNVMRTHTVKIVQAAVDFVLTVNNVIT